MSFPVGVVDTCLYNLQNMQGLNMYVHVCCIAFAADIHLTFFSLWDTET